MTDDRSLRGLQVLVVEDHYTIATELVRLMRGLGAVPVGPFGRLDTALLAARDTNQHLDTAILDVNLHDEAVFAVADVLRSRQVPFIIVSGYQRSALPVRYQNELVLEKPVDGKLLTRLLQETVYGPLKERLASQAVSP